MERISCVLELKEDDFHYNIYNELKELYKDRVYNEPEYRDKFNELGDFMNEYLEFVKDDNNENFKKYNVRHLRDYPNRIGNNYVKCRLCILKKEVLGIEKDTCVFIADFNLYGNLYGIIVGNLYGIIIFYLKEDSKNIELAKEVWINELNYGNFKGKNEYIRDDDDNRKCVWKWDSFEIKNKEKYIAKCLTSHSYTQIIAQTKFVMKEVKL
jgi:hypothetical protein